MNAEFRPGTPRSLTRDLLMKMDSEAAYSNIALDNVLSRSALSERDRAFVTALFYGVTERRMTLDFVIRQYSTVEFDKIDADALAALRIGLYQILYMHTPENAAVNESVTLAGMDSRGFVNGVLRAFLRAGKQMNLDSVTDAESRLSIEYSCARWLVKQWLRDYGKDRTLSLLEGSFGRPPLYLRVNTLGSNVEDVMASLKSEGVSAQKNPLLPECVEITKMGKLTGIESAASYKKGWFHVQDISSQLYSKVIRPMMTETVIDICSAPGGKAFSVAEIMNNRGKLLACELYDARLAMVESGKNRLGLDMIETLENDGLVRNPNLPLADKVLVDAPCSGFGVIRRKPEIKYKQKKSVEELPHTQEKLLDISAGYVKPGGRLCYSTCTLNTAENERVAEKFLSAHPEFSPVISPSCVPGIEDAANLTFFPEQTGGDGFFVAVFRKNAN